MNVNCGTRCYDTSERNIWLHVSKQYVCNVDYWTTIPELPNELDTEVLIFMTVDMSGHFKNPIAYVLPR